MSRSQQEALEVFPHRRFTPSEAVAAGFDPVHIRSDDGTVQTMRRPGSTYRVTYGAPSYAKAVEASLRAKGPGHEQ